MVHNPERSDKLYSYTQPWNEFDRKIARRGGGLMNDVRRSGLKLLLIAGVFSVVLGYLALRVTSEGWQVHGYGWGIPGAFALAGLAQLVSGVPFSELSSRWDALQGWQRGVLGTLIVLVATGLIFLVLIAFMTLAYGS